jgi:uncharacterized membrane protein (DUF485 family)
MYIEMTSFAVPTFLLSAIKFLLFVGAAWFVMGLIVMSIYSYTTARNIERQMKIDAEIDRLHK